MFKPTPSLAGSLRRMPLTTKNGPKDFYKGNRTGSMGEHTSRGGYKIDYKKVRTYVAPQNLDTFDLTPFVATRIDKPRYNQKEDEIATAKGWNDVDKKTGVVRKKVAPSDGILYLEKWKMVNGQS